MGGSRVFKQDRSLLAVVALYVEKKALEAHICYKIKFQKELDTFLESRNNRVNLRANGPMWWAFHSSKEAQSKSDRWPLYAGLEPFC